VETSLASLVIAFAQYFASINDCVPFRWPGAVTIVLSLTLIGGARADTNSVAGGRVLTLQEAKRTAFLHNWDLLAARSGVALADAQRIVAHEFPNPTLSYLTGRISTDGNGNATPAGNDLWDRSYDSILAVNQLFEIGGKRTARQISAAAAWETARARLADARRTLDAGVTKAYVAAALADAKADIARIRFKAGDISRSDFDQIEIAADQDELNAKSAVAAAVQQRIAVEVLLGERNPKGNWTEGDALDLLASLPTVPPRPDNADRPDLVAARAALRQAEADLRLQKAMRIPDPTFLIQYERAPPDQPNTVGVGVSLPLPLWNRNGGAIQAARETQDQAARAVEQTKAQIASDIATARSVYDEAQARWRHYHDDLQPKSGQIRMTVSFAYEKGGVSLVDFLEAQRNDNTIRLATAQAAADTATAATTLFAALNKTSGDDELEGTKP